MKEKRKIDKINGFWENKKKGRSSHKRDFCFSMHGKNKESFNRADSFFKEGRRKDFLGKEGFSWEGGFQKEGGFDE